MREKFLGFRGFSTSCKNFPNECSVSMQYPGGGNLLDQMSFPNILPTDEAKTAKVFCTFGGNPTAKLFPRLTLILLFTVLHA